MRRRVTPTDETFLSGEETPTPTLWAHIELELEDGSRLDLRVPAIGGGLRGYYTPAPDERPSLTLTRGGAVKRARLDSLLG